MKEFSPYVIFYTMHLIGLVFGLGGVTATDALSLYGFIKPQSLKKHVDSYTILSLIIWVGLFLLIVSGIALIYISKIEIGGDLASNMYELPLKSSAYIFMLALNGVIILNGLFLNFKVTPAFKNAVELEDFTATSEYKRALKLGVISGGISFLSWWGVFFINVYLFRVIS